MPTLPKKSLHGKSRPRFLTFRPNLTVTRSIIKISCSEMLAPLTSPPRRILDIRRDALPGRKPAPFGRQKPDELAHVRPAHHPRRHDAANACRRQRARPVRALCPDCLFAGDRKPSITAIVTGHTPSIRCGDCKIIIPTLLLARPLRVCSARVAIVALPPIRRTDDYHHAGPSLCNCQGHASCFGAEA